MAREPKFKAWNTIVQRMSDPFTIEEIYNTKNVQFLNLIWLEYTGLKDKNGKEIYESDLIRHGTIERISEVKFIEGSFALCHDHHNTCLRHFGLSECEVIGNIYEHPELLTTSQEGK